MGLAERHERIVAVKECSGDARRIAHLVELAGDSLEVLVGGDDWALEGYAAGAVGWVSGVANVAPAQCLELESLVARRSGGARALPQPAAAAGALDMTPKLVQYFKAALDLRQPGGPTRAPRLPLTEAERRPLRRGRRPGAARRSALGAARLPRRRLAHRGDADARDHRRRGRAPGATMLERKLRFEPSATRAHAADARAARARRDVGRDPPAAAPRRRRLGRVYIEVCGCLPMCGHGTIGVATVLVETGMVEVREPETSSASTCPPASSRRACRWRTAGRSP